jgi:hypothetical protein
MTTTSIIPPRVPFIDDRTGTIAREWYLFLLGLRNLGDATLADLAQFAAADLTARAPLPPPEADIVSPAAPRLADFQRLDRELADLWEYVGTSLRQTPADLVTLRGRETLSNKTLVAPTLTGTTTAGAINATGSEVRATSLRIDTAPIAGALLATHKVAVNVNGTPYFILLST